MKTLKTKNDRSEKTSLIIDIFNAHPCISWEVNKAINEGEKEDVIFSIFDEPNLKTSFIQAERIINLSNINTIEGQKRKTIQKALQNIFNSVHDTELHWVQNEVMQITEALNIEILI